MQNDRRSKIHESHLRRRTQKRMTQNLRDKKFCCFGNTQKFSGKRLQKKGTEVSIEIRVDRTQEWATAKLITSDGAGRLESWQGGTTPRQQL